MTTRKSKQLSRKELSTIRKALKPYGAKAELARFANLPVQTIHRIIENGSGLEQNIEKIQEFFNREKAVA